MTERAADARERRAAVVCTVGVFALKWVGARWFLAPWDLLQGPWHFGYEAGHIAGNLAAGRGFSIAVADGRALPSAWISPLYPLLLAGIFRVFGPFSASSAQVAVAANCLFQALTAGLLYRLASRAAGRRVAIAAVVLFAANPGGWQFLAWAWPTQLFALAILAHVDRLCRARSGGVVAAALCGGSLGAALLVDGAAIVLLPVSAAALWAAAPAPRRPASLAAASLALALVLAPWALRNQLALGVANPLRGNVGVNLWVGNHPGARVESFHGIRQSPWHNPIEAKRLAERGEREYDRLCRERALARIARAPGTFAANSALRWSGFWLGEWWAGFRHVAWPYTLGHVALSLLAALGLWRARRSCAGFAIAALLAFSLPYAVTVHGHGRYRVPVEPILCYFGALALGSSDLARKRAADSARSRTG